MHVLDTDSLSLFQAGDPHITQRMSALPPEQIATTIITKAGLLRGRCEFLLKADDKTLLRAQELLAVTETILLKLKILRLDSSCLLYFHRLHATKKLRR